MKKIVYECGVGDYASECEISHDGKVVVVRGVRDSTIFSSGNEGLVGIDFVSMVEMTGDMAEKFIKSGEVRPDTLESLERFICNSREYLREVVENKVVS